MIITGHDLMKLQVAPMIRLQGAEVIMTRDGTEPYPLGARAPGTIFVPSFWVAWYPGTRCPGTGCPGTVESKLFWVPGARAPAEEEALMSSKMLNNLKIIKK